jgi:drug/metabolite transporter (DMT)-like permease
MNPRFTAPALPATLGAGMLLALTTALLSGVSIWVNAFAVKQLPDPAVYTTVKNGFAAILLLGLMVATVRPTTIRAISPRSFGRLLVIGVVGGSVPFILFFTGLAQASAPSAAFIHKTLFVWVALLAVPFLGEKLGLAQLLALGVLLAGQALVLTPSGVTWGTGETMVAAATLLWAVESIVAKRALRDVPSAVVGASRLGIGLIVLVGFLAATGRLGTVAALSATQWTWAALTGAFLFGYVATWFAALQRAPASLVTAILVLGAPVTAAIQLATSGTVPTAPMLAGQGLILAAGAALAIPVLMGWRRQPVRVPASAATT